MMRERILAAYDPFVLPFVFGMTFVLSYCVLALIRIVQDRVLESYGFEPEPEIRIFRPEGGR